MRNDSPRKVGSDTAGIVATFWMMLAANALESVLDIPLMESSATAAVRPVAKPTRQPGTDFPSFPLGQERHSPNRGAAGNGDTMAPDATLPPFPKRSTFILAVGAAESSSGARVLSVACGNTIATVSPSPMETTMREPASVSQLVSLTGRSTSDGEDRPESESPRPLSPQPRNRKENARQEIPRAHVAGMEVICPSLEGCARPTSPRAE